MSLRHPGVGTFEVTCDGGAVIEMSDRELTRLRVMIDLADDRLTVDAAGSPSNLPPPQDILG